jgi:serralysin
LDLGGDDFFTGGEGDDRFIDDFLYFGGNAGNDVLFGEGGNDELGADSLQPGTGGGDDFLSGGPGLDTLDGGDGSDSADYSEKADTVSVILNGPTTADVLVGGFIEDTVVNIENVNGGFANDALIGDGFINRLVGADGNDRLFGNGGNDALFGGNGDDKIKGGADNDAIHGGDGNDRLRGGPGSDSFFFDSQPDAQNIDRLFAFSHSADTIVLEDDIFDKTGFGALKAKFFRVGSEAADLSDRIIYDDATGALYYDQDGSGAAAEVQFARLAAGLNIAANDFLVM